jgi:hypothetical protein
MMILHGDNTILSRQRLQQEIKTFKSKKKGEVLRFEGSNLNLTDLQQALESLSLLEKNRLIIIENLFSGRSSREKNNIIAYLKKSNSVNLIIWEGKKIDGRTLSFFKSQVLRFDLPLVVFRFLDSLAPDNTVQSINLFHQSLEQNPPELIFHLLSRQIRLLILAIDLKEKGLISMKDWQKGKLIRQAKKFGLEKLIKIYQELLKIDWQQKTSQTPFNLVSQLDLFLASF